MIDLSAAHAAALVLASALLHAAWNAMLKRQKDAPAAAAAILAVAGACAIAGAYAARGPAFPTREAFVWAVVAAACEAAYFVTLARSLARLPLGVAYTISRGGSVLLVWPASIAFYGERVHPLGAVGASLVFIGVVATGTPRSAERLRAFGRAGIVWAVACAAFIAGAYLCYKRSLAAGAEPAALFAASLVFAFPPNLVLVGSRAIGRVFQSVCAKPASIIAAGCVLTFSSLLFLIALETSGPGRVLTLRNTSVVFAHLFAWFGGERPSGVQVVGGVLVAGGATLLGLA